MEKKDKLKKDNFIIEYYSKSNIHECIPLSFGTFKHFGVNRLYMLRWKPECNPYSNDDESPSRNIGYIAFTDTTTLIGFVFMKREYRGMGLGEFMYSEVVKKEGFLTTNFSYDTEDAKRVWEKLLRHFPHRKFYDDGLNYRIYPK